MMELEGRTWGDQEVLASLTELPSLSKCVILPWCSVKSISKGHLMLTIRSQNTQILKQKEQSSENAFPSKLGKKIRS